MAEWVERQWISIGGSGLGRRARVGGKYQAFCPDPLGSRGLSLPTELSRSASRTEQKILELSDRGTRRQSDSGAGLEGIARFLLRSEAISSSRIEGMAPGPDKVAIAELTAKDTGARVASVPQLVANNVSVLQQMSGQLHEADEMTVEDIVAAQALLLGDLDNSGLREKQNWIGGSSYSPLEAEFVPPPPERVPELMDDLVDYLNGATHGAVIQAAMVHAQFETIHPFADGNGRVGRALIHAVLQRRGLVDSPVLPISMILGTWSDRYVHGLTRFRDTTPDSTGVLEWIDIFVQATAEAADHAQRIAGELESLRQEWRERVADHRRQQGKTRGLRTDSMGWKILENLPDHPLLTGPVAAEVFGTSRTSAGKALESLVEAGVLRKKSIDRGVTGYLADEVFDLITIAERRLASTRFDTAVAPPTARAVPELPDR